MRVKECKEGLPSRQRNRMRDHLSEFVHMNVEIGKVEFDEHEYASCYTAANVLGKAAKRGAFPVKVIIRNGEVYLKRTDM